MQVIRIFRTEGVKLSELFEKCLITSIDQMIDDVESNSENGGAADECFENQ